MLQSKRNATVMPPASMQPDCRHIVHCGHADALCFRQVHKAPPRMTVAAGDTTANLNWHPSMRAGRAKSMPVSLQSGHW